MSNTGAKREGYTANMFIVVHFLFKIWSKNLIKQFAIAQASIYYTYRFNRCLNNYFTITLTEYILIENILDAFFLHIQFREKLITAFQRCLESHIDACHYRIDPLLVKCRKTDTGRQQELMARMFQVMLIIGIIDNALQVAFIVAHFHCQLINIFSHITL